HTATIVFAGTTNGKIWRTLNANLGAGSNWTEIDHGLLPFRSITSLRGFNGDASGNSLIAGFSGFSSCAGCDGKGHIFGTINGGTSWTNLSGDLPDAPVNDIIIDKNGGTHFLLIATDVGVFECPNVDSTNCPNWTVVGDGLPNSPVLALTGRASQILQAATHGRSMWNIQLTNVQPGNLATLNSMTPAAVMVGAPTTLVTINGFNFSSNTLVLFNGVSVGTPTFVNTTQ